MIKKIFIIALIMFSFLNANSQTTITVQPNSFFGKDALLHGLSSEANNNFGSNNQLTATAWTFIGTPGVVRAVLDFDLSSIPNGATINSAYLSLYAMDSNIGFGQHSTLSGSNECWIQRITNAWDENTVTWNSQPAITTINQVTIGASSSPIQNYLNIDVTNLVQDMIDNTTSSFGFLLRLQNESYYRRMNFASSDHMNSALHPKIEITFTDNSTSVHEQSSTYINYYPIPCQDILNIEIKNSNATNFTIEILDVQGQLVESELFYSNSLFSIDVSKLTKGVYILRVSNKKNVSIRKLLIK